MEIKEYKRIKKELWYEKPNYDLGNKYLRKFIKNCVLNIKRYIYNPSYIEFYKVHVEILSQHNGVIKKRVYYGPTAYWECVILETKYGWSYEKSKSKIREKKIKLLLNNDASHRLA